jgi:hypothetical protein
MNDTTKQQPNQLAAMGFTPFVGQGGGLGTDGVTLRADGSICFLSGFRERRKLDQYTCVELHEHQQKKIVALRLCNAETPPMPGARVVRVLRHDKNGREANAASWVAKAHSWGYPKSQALDYEAYDDGIIVLKKEAAGAGADATEATAQ